jgi:hypothetical protein
MATSFTGGCRCGALRYECSAEPVMAGNCHCRLCQQVSGSAFTANVAVPKDALRIMGDVKYHEAKADSGNTVSLGFCPSCGAPVVGRSSGMPDLMMLRAGSLDDPSWYRPGMDLYTASAQPWDHMNPDLPKFPQMPPMQPR